jgi:hypothetical protein
MPFQGLRWRLLTSLETPGLLLSSPFSCSTTFCALAKSKAAALYQSELMMEAAATNVTLHFAVHSCHAGSLSKSREHA